MASPYRYNDPVDATGPLLSISIVSHGNEAEVVSLLESLSLHEDPSRIRLILTGNLRDDLPEVDTSRWKSVTLLRNEHPRGFAANHNAAFARAQGEYFCLLNPDVLFLEPALDRLIARLDAQDADLIAPLAVDGDGRVQDSFRPLPTPIELFRRRALGVAALDERAIRESPLLAPDWIAGYFQLMPARVYRDLGGMDERFRLYLEDVDFCTRARLKGCKVRIDTTLRFRHDGRRASREDPRFFLWHLASALRFFSSPVYRQARRGE